LSAKWRRNRKNSNRFHVIRNFNKNANKRNFPIWYARSSKIKKRLHPLKYDVLRIDKKTGWKEPKPLIDVLEDKDEIIVVADFAGFKKENLKIKIKNQRLILSAKALERKYYKSLNLPKKVIPESLRTRYKNGVLEIRLKKDIKEKAIDELAG
jgi:HSP20 family molecular chaperone IbpA